MWMPFSPQEYGVTTTKDSGFSAYVEELITGWLEDGTINGLIEETDCNKRKYTGGSRMSGIFSETAW